MDYYCQCKNCRYCDSGERDGYKWHCDYYGTYEDPDEVKECKNYSER